jgi:putative hydrolase of the HAD superfamily
MPDSIHSFSFGAAPTLIFDLDNTLYPASCRLFDQIDHRMTAFTADLLGLSVSAARQLQKEYFYRYGTTLKGLMKHHDVDPHEFLDAVHAIDLSVIPANPALQSAMARYPGRKIIYTNGSRRHAENVLDALRLSPYMDCIIGIAETSWQPKPCPNAFQQMLEQAGVAVPTQAIMFDDIPRNLEPAAAAGLTTVWIDGDENEYHHLQSAQGTPAATYIHHTSRDVLSWLEEHFSVS